MEIWVNGKGKGRRGKGIKRVGWREIRWDKMEREECKKRMGKVENVGRNMEGERKEMEEKIKVVREDRERKGG